MAASHIRQWECVFSIPAPLLSPRLCGGCQHCIQSTGTDAAGHHASVILPALCAFHRCVQISAQCTLGKRMAEERQASRRDVGPYVLLKNGHKIGLYTVLLVLRETHVTTSDTRECEKGNIHG